MEPPAVSVGLGYQRNSSSLEKSRRDLMLRIDPQLTYASTSHAFEELPENFLESISPQQNNSTCALEINTNHLQNELGPSCLSPGIGDQRFSNENIELLPHLSEQGINAGLLVGSVVDELGHESRQSTYIKEESPDVYHNSGPCETIYLPSFEHDDGNLCHLHSPISLQNDLVASVLSSGEHFLPVRQPERVIKRDKSPSPVPESKVKLTPIKTEEETVNANFAALNEQLTMNLDDNSYLDTKDLCQQIANELKQHAIPQAVFADKILCRSQGTLSDLLRNPKPWEKLKSGRETFRRMQNWILMPLQIRLAILDIKRDSTDFASLVNSSPPTPAKSSRGRQPSISDDCQSKRPRLVFTDVQKRTLQAIFKETQGEREEEFNESTTVSWFMPNIKERFGIEQGRRCHLKLGEDKIDSKKLIGDQIDSGDMLTLILGKKVVKKRGKKNTKVMFTISYRPSREMQNTIADHLGLDLSTVSNFFMNARRRSRNGGALIDEGNSSEQATPPPKTPPKSGQRRHNASSSSSSSGNQINDTVDSVIANFKTEPYEEIPHNYSSRSRSSRRIEQKLQIKSEREESPSMLQGSHF